MRSPVDWSRRRIVIVGAGSQGSIVADILQRAHEAGSSGEPIGFVDDFASVGQAVLGLSVLGSIDALSTIDHDAIVLAIGDNAKRRALTERLLASGEALATAIHPFTSIAPTATIGEGSMVSAGALVLPRANVGRGVLLNTKSSVDHDTILGDFVHVSAGATVGANVRIGDEAFIALGASVASERRVGARTIIGAGAVVVRDIPDDVIAYGVPARITSYRRS
ncbi:MAG TPA: acetyltransferase [Thermoanaerobaculia bacterium]|nr:acetyltransferase [Thermoanaerobaculia bacterium]